MNISFKKILLLSIFLFIILTISYKHLTHEFAIENAETKIEELLVNYKAFRSYVSNVQKEEIYRLQDEHIISKDYFRPQLLSSTFSAKNVNNFYNGLRLKNNQPPIVISFSSTNPRNPENLSSKQEAEILKKFNNNEIKKYSKIITTEHGKALYYAVPTKRTTKECMRCHSDPKLAPKS